MPESFRRIMLVGVALVITGCTSGGFGAEHSPTPIPTEEATATRTPPTRIPTTPTMASEQVVEIVEEAVRSNGGCELPCWWGGDIDPGETSVEDANVWVASHIPRSSEVGTSEYTLPDAKSDQLYIATIQISEENGFVSSISNRFVLFGDDPSRMSEVLKSQYAWDRVFTAQGEPTEIRFFLATRSAGNASYELTLVYYEIGMMIQYNGSAEMLSSTNGEACLDFGVVSTVELLLVPPSDTHMLYDLVAVQAIFGGQALVEATGVSVPDFVEQMSSPESSVCLRARAAGS